MSTKRLYCDVKAGINTCKICFDECFYHLKIPQPKHPTLKNMALLRCGHGMCYTCYNTMISTREFSCPVCRKRFTWNNENFWLFRFWRNNGYIG